MDRFARPHPQFFAVALLLAAALLAPAPALAQAKAPAPQQKARSPRPRPAVLASGFEQRVYDLRTLLAAVPDNPGPTITLRPPSQGEPGIAGKAFYLQEPRRFLSEDDIGELITTNIAEDSWSDKRTFIEITPDVELVVVQTPDVHAKIAQMLAYVSHEADTQIAVEGKVAFVDDALLDACRSNAPGPVVLTEPAAKALNDALAKGDRATLLKSLHATARNGERVSAVSLIQNSFVNDYDAQSTMAVASWDPIIGYVQIGAVLDVRPTWMRGRLACEVRFARTDGPLPVPTFDTGVPKFGPLGVPELDAAEVETTVTGGDAQTLLVGRVKVPDPRPGAVGGAPARSLCFILRAAVVPQPDAAPPASEEKRQTRIFDVDLLTSSLQDFPAAALGLLRYGVGIEAAREPTPLTRPATLLESVRHNVAPASWENTRNAIEYRGHLLVARQTPEVLEGIAKHLDELAARRLRMIHTRVDLVAVDAPAHGDLLARSPSVAAGKGKLSAEEAADILGRAAKMEGGLSLAGSGEVAGMNGERVSVRRTFQMSYVRDYDIMQNGDFIQIHDPQIDVVEDGLVLDCRPALGADGKTVHAELRVSWARLERPVAVGVINDKGYKMQHPKLAVAPVRASVVAEAGRPVLVGVGGPIKVGDAEKHLLAIVRFTPD